MFTAVYFLIAIAVTGGFGVLAYGSMLERRLDETHSQHPNPRLAATFGIAAGVALTAFGLGWPAVSVWLAHMEGRAELAHAEFSKQVKVQEAIAVRDAATDYAEAEVRRAHGVAQANQIIANGLGGPEGYLRYLYIETLKESRDKQIIYIPTEAGLPILEAGRRQGK